MKFFSVLLALVAGVSARMLSGFDPCTNIACGELKCPGGFDAIHHDGHCCPVCENPDVDISKAPTGPSPDGPGKMSDKCGEQDGIPGVFCFPVEIQCPGKALVDGPCCKQCP